MLEANKNHWFEKLFTIYNRNLLKRRFHSFNVSGLDFLKNRDLRIPSIIYANHSSWWDGLIIFEICRKLNCDFYVMMEEKQLKNLPLFRKLGAFSVIRENPREAVKSINYAVNLLKTDSAKTILIFPQGEIQPNDRRPLIFFNGLSRIIAKTGKCAVVPLSIRLEFLGQYKPEIFVKISEPQLFSDDLKFDSKSLTLNLAEILTRNLDNLKNKIVEKNFSDFENSFHNK